MTAITGFFNGSMEYKPQGEILSIRTDSKLRSYILYKLIDISNQQQYIKSEEMLQCPDDVNKSYKISTRGN